MPAAARYQSQAVKGGNAIKRNAAWSNELLATAAPLFEPQACDEKTPPPRTSMTPKAPLSLRVSNLVDGSASACRGVSGVRGLDWA
jgi:hypothetical protein